MTKNTNERVPVEQRQPTKNDSGLIVALHPDSEADLPLYVEKWNKIAMSTSEIDVSESLKYAKIAYEKANIKFPNQYRVYDSPMQAITELKKDFGITISYSDFCYGSHDANWLSYYDVMLREAKIDYCSNLDGLLGIAEHCGWWLPFDEMVVFTRKPVKVSYDDQNLIHSSEGLAIEYKDGFGVAVWHGVTIPPEWVLNKDSITADVMLHWENIEQRRCACEIRGWDSLLAELNPKTIDKHPQAQLGELLEVNIPGIGKERFLRVECATGRYFSLPVPMDIKTVVEAQSWSYKIPVEEFNVELRT